MHKIKKVIKRLRDYLGRDTTGLQLLDSVADAANTIRGQASDFAIRAALAEEMNRRLRKELDQAQAIAAGLKLEVKHQEDLNRQAQRDIKGLAADRADLEQQIERERLPDVEAPIPSAAGIEQRFVELFSDLRRDYPACPVGSVIRDADSITTTYDLWDLIRGLTNRDITKIGRFVVCRALANMPVVIPAASNLMTMGLHVDTTEKGDGEGFKKWMGRWVYWWRNNLDSETDICGDWTANKGQGTTIRTRGRLL